MTTKFIKKNFRSTEGIIDTALQLINNNVDRISSKEMIHNSDSEKKTEEGDIVHRHFLTPMLSCGITLAHKSRSSCLRAPFTRTRTVEPVPKTSNFTSIPITMAHSQIHHRIRIGSDRNESIYGHRAAVFEPTGGR